LKAKGAISALRQKGEGKDRGEGAALIEVKGKRRERE